MRRGAAILALAALSVALAQDSGAGSKQLPGIALGTALCPRPVSLSIEFGSWSEPRPASPHEFSAAVWSRGGSGEGGLDIYASVTPTASRLSRLCRRISQRGVSSTAALGARFSYRMTDSGNAYFVDARGAVTPGSPHVRSVDPLAARNAMSVIFDCDVSQRVVVHTHALPRQAGYYLSVRTQRNRKLLAVATVRRSGASIFRVARSCRQD